MATANGSNGNGGDGSNGGGGRRRPGIPQPPKPRKESSKTKRQRALIAHIIANMDIPPLRNEQPRVAPVQMALCGAGPSHVGGSVGVSGIPTVADMVVDTTPPSVTVVPAPASAPVAADPPVSAPPAPAPGSPAPADSICAPADPAPPRVTVTRFEAPRGAPFRVFEYPKVKKSEGPSVAQHNSTLDVVRVAPPPPPPPPPSPSADDVGGAENVDVDMDEVIAAEDGKAMVLSIVVRSYTLGDVGVMYNIRTDETFDAIYKDYASRIDVKPQQIKLHLGVEYVASTEYPLAVGVQTGSVLYVHGEPGVVNTCTRFKRFYLKNTGHRRKIKLRVQGKLDTPLCRLFHIWGDKFNVDPTELIFYHEDTVLCTLNTIKDAEIKNGDKVVVAPNGQP